MTSTTSTDTLKHRAAVHAVDHFVRSGMVVGLGTGSTAAHAVVEIGARLRDGRLHDIVGIPTSEATARLARESGVPLTTLEARPTVDVTIDGADEVDPVLNLIKGLGGALLREKVVATASRRTVIIVDDSKRVARLGTRAPLPVEVVPFGWSIHLPFFQELEAEPELRRLDDGRAFVTDNGHYIVDCRFPEGLQDPHAIARALDERPGIVEHGLFLNLATDVVIATPHGTEVVHRG
ncbi:MAG: ribose 5-phosphate isomerase A [Ardenticatenia bacterium]|nr:ribose 5-phosphate isomerase A [Ardenticatenia bacterium]